ncbi:Kinesin-like protein kif27 [Chytriomyces hyalinus]|nr:Kinesin-like protein kif27 [Chytriomyces hyalinus]KAJ3239148.1 Kinesin-like protein kif27 [Chytriomyces hyalinus]
MGNTLSRRSSLVSPVCPDEPAPNPPDYSIAANQSAGIGIILQKLGSSISCDNLKSTTASASRLNNKRRPSQSSSAIEKCIKTEPEPPARNPLSSATDSNKPIKTASINVKPIAIHVAPTEFREIHTAETVIEDVKSRYLGKPDSTYSIEEFTALMAFGVQLNVDHPSLTPAHYSTTAMREEHSGSAPRVSSPRRESIFTAEDVIDQVKEKHLTADPSTFSMEEIITFFGVENTRSSSARNIADPSEAADMDVSSRVSTGQRNSSTSETPDASTCHSRFSFTRLSTTNTPDSGRSRSSVRNLTDSERLQLELPYFEREIKNRMYPVTYRMGDFIIRKHEIGHEMYFLSKGTVEVVSGDGKTVYSVIHKGSFFGELGVLFNVPRTASVRACDDCYCMILTRDNLDVVLKHFPNIAQRFRQVAERRMSEVKKMISYKQMLEYQQKMEAVKEEE